MSLTDLKKKHTQKKGKSDFTVDDFIDDADNYAQGAPKLVSAGKEKPAKLELEQAMVLAEKQYQKKKNAKPYRHATFTLSEEAITELGELAQDSKLAKSHILRILIHEMSNDKQKQRLMKILSDKVD